MGKIASEQAVYINVLGIDCLFRGDLRYRFASNWTEMLGVLTVASSSV